MTRTLILTTALLTACATPTTREICDTNADGWEWCVTVLEIRK